MADLFVDVSHPAALAELMAADVHDEALLFVADEAELGSCFFHRFLWGEQ
jgi:hypothetical protein